MATKKVNPFAKGKKPAVPGVKQEKPVTNLPPWLKKKGTVVPKKKKGK